MEHNPMQRIIKELMNIADQHHIENYELPDDIYFDHTCRIGCIKIAIDLRDDNALCFRVWSDFRLYKNQPVIQCDNLNEVRYIVQAIYDPFNLAEDYIILERNR
jgi:hypothetical protein